MPPIVTGSIVAAIGLNLAPVAVKSMSASGFDTAIGLLTVLAVALIAVHTRGVLQRLPVCSAQSPDMSRILSGTSVLGFGKPIDLSASRPQHGSVCRTFRRRCSSRRPCS